MEALDEQKENWRGTAGHKGGERENTVKWGRMCKCTNSQYVGTILADIGEFLLLTSGG